MLECYEVKRWRDEYDKAITPNERLRILTIINNHKKTCVVCNGSYQTAGLKQLHEQTYAGTWGNGKG